MPTPSGNRPTGASKANTNASRKRSAVSEEPRQASEGTTARRGRAVRRVSDLTVQRENLHPAKPKTGEAEIVRVKTGVDRTMLVLILILLSLGSIMVFSASYPSALAERGDSLYYIKKQLLFIAVGVGAMILASVVPPSLYKSIDYCVRCGLVSVGDRADPRDRHQQRRGPPVAGPERHALHIPAVGIDESSAGYGACLVSGSLP